MHYLFFASVIFCAHLRADPLIGLPPEPKLSPIGYQLIMDYEVGGGRPYYERFLSHPTWPGLASGVTVGIGYDCGYNSSSCIRSDWHGLEEKERLAASSGLKGVPAKYRSRQLRDILVAWSLAENVFQKVTLARFCQLARRTFPGFDDLHPNCQAALVSLIFNRGNSLSGPGRVEMREISRLVPRKDYLGIAAQLRSMKRLWPGISGLIRRREAEAKLVESSLI